MRIRAVIRQHQLGAPFRAQPGGIRPETRAVGQHKPGRGRENIAAVILVPDIQIAEKSSFMQHAGVSRRRHNQQDSFAGYGVAVAGSRVARSEILQPPVQVGIAQRPAELGQGDGQRGRLPGRRERRADCCWIQDGGGSHRYSSVAVIKSKIFSRTAKRKPGSTSASPSTNPGSWSTSGSRPGRNLTTSRVSASISQASLVP